MTDYCDFPASEPEVQSIVNYVQQKLENHTIMAISLHSFGQVFFLPYAGNENSQHPDYQVDLWLKKISPTSFKLCWHKTNITSFLYQLDNGKHLKESKTLHISSLLQVRKTKTVGWLSYHINWSWLEVVWKFENLVIVRTKTNLLLLWKISTFDISQNL